MATKSGIAMVVDEPGLSGLGAGAAAGGCGDDDRGSVDDRGRNHRHGDGRHDWDHHDAETTTTPTDRASPIRAARAAPATR